jgi:hypothetical protein
MFLKSKEADLKAPIISVSAATTDVTGVEENSYFLVKDYEV